MPCGQILSSPTTPAACSVMGAGNCTGAMVYRHRRGNASPKPGLMPVFHRGDAPLFCQWMAFVNGSLLSMDRS